MEDWQIVHITSNLPSLIKTTTCSTVFISILQSRGVLSAEEVQILDAHRRNYGDVRAASYLYALLETRSDGFRILLQALEETSQSGALVILQAGLREQGLPNGEDLVSEQPTPQTGWTDWQLTHTNHYLSELVETVKCTPGVYKHLKQNGILSEAEETSLVESKESGSDFVELYELLKRRDNGYSIFTETLEVTCQTGALDIWQGATEGGMEVWQKEYINENLAKLIECTKCSDLDGFINGLHLRELITAEEIHIIKHLGRSEAASTIYEILQTRRNGYSEIMDALKESGLTEAWNILQNGYSKKTCSLSLENSECSEQLQEIQVRQRDRVERCLERLIENTKCNTSLKAHLLGKKVISLQEKNRMTLIGTREGPVNEVEMLYNIILKTPNGVTKLIDALEKTCQTGARDILSGVAHGGMEVWQSNHINRNLTSLITCTNCNLDLLHNLSEQELISLEERENLTELMDKNQREKAAMDLYDILKSRTDSYTKLMEALDASGESTASDILGAGLHDHETSSSDSYNFDKGGQTDGSVIPEMQHWQQQYIIENFVRLSINCSILFKASLLESEVLNIRDYHELCAVGNTKGNLEETHELYRILTHRPKSYSSLMVALRKSSQIQAFNVLLEGMSSFLVTLPVQLSDSQSKLNDIFPIFTPEDSIHVLKQGEVWKEICNLMDYSGVSLNLNGEIPESHTLYISRSISNRLMLDAKVFHVQCPDIFVFKGLERNDEQLLQKLHFIVSSSSQCHEVNAKFIRLDDEEDWDEMISTTPSSPMHLVSKEDGAFILQRSTEVTDTILNHSSASGNAHQVHTSEDEFINNITLLNSDEGAILCDVPGMGKTWLMESLARKLQKEHKKYIVFKIEVAAFGKLLGKLKNVPQKSETAKFILDYACKSKLQYNILWNHAAKNGYEFVYFLDGFDEIAVQDVEVTTKFLTELNTIQNLRFIISSRPHMRAHLMKTFGLIPFDILPFTMEEQISTIAGVWMGMFPNGTEDGFRQLAKQCIETTKSIQHCDDNDILGVPLKCYMLSVVNSPQAERVSRISAGKRCKIDVTATIKSTCGLYEKFLETKSELNAEDMKQPILTFHTYTALELLFPTIATQYLMSQNFTPMATRHAEILRMGILCTGLDSTFYFIHKSFAEFLAGKFFDEFWKDNSIYESRLVETTGLFFTRSLFVFPENCILDVNSIHRENITKAVKCETNSFTFGVVLWFLNNISGPKDIKVRHKMCLQHFKTVLLSRRALAKWNTISNKQCLRDPTDYKAFKVSIKNMIYTAILGCVDARFTKVLSFLLQLVNVFFKDEAVPSLLIAPKRSTFPNDLVTRQTASVPLLLNRISLSGSHEITTELFCSFGEPEQSILVKTCENFPSNFVSPTETAIVQNDVDMFKYFLQLVNMPTHRLLVACVNTASISEDEITRRISIFDSVTALDTDNPCNATPYDFKSYLESLSADVAQNHRQMRDFTRKHKISLFYLPTYNKCILLKDSLCNDQADEVIELLLLLFRNQNESNRVGSSTTSQLHFKTDSEQDLSEQLDLKNANDTFLQLKFDCTDVFENIDSPKAHKVFTRICADFTLCCVRKQNYLHYAVRHGHVGWVEDLLNSGYDVNQPDRDGNTPILCITYKHALEITKVLIEHKANVLAVNNAGENVAHRLFVNCRYPSIYNKWIALMLEKGFQKLWWRGENSGES